MTLKWHISPMLKNEDVGERGDSRPDVRRVKNNNNVVVIMIMIMAMHSEYYVAYY